MDLVASEVAPDPPPEELLQDGSLVLVFDHLPVRQDERCGLKCKSMIAGFASRFVTDLLKTLLLPGAMI